MTTPIILMADDSVTIQKVFELAFEDEAVDLITVGDGGDALRLAMERRPALIIADVNMPGLSGFELCAALREAPETTLTPVYLLASSLDEYDANYADEVGATGKFEKPFKSEDMVTKVMAALESALAENPAIGVADPGEAVLADEDVALEANLEEDEEPEAVVEEASEEVADDEPVEEMVGGDNEVDKEIAEKGFESEEQFDDLDASLDEMMTGPAAEEVDVEIDAAIEDQEAGTDDEAAENELANDEQTVAPPQRTAPLQQELYVPVTISDEDRMIDALETAGDEAGGEEELTFEPAEAEPEEETREGEKNGAEAANQGAITPPGPGREEIAAMVQEALDKAMDELVSSERFTDVVAAATYETLEKLKPGIMTAVENVAAKITLKTAEELIRKTIDEIKTGQ